ncbi:GntR family transcriptional regulator [Shinella daejeonensis]|uniref:GntR family transcriptional regulator n=1 Tax=Shinella daejeonensis TaxID=659017 RepID=UPI0020C77190|nr:GntR family transcriptional regulator [Shinella daejeonensis]MCP8894793.1 GntR family transcriptional regulator [Shinella daejeonensis]
MSILDRGPSLTDQAAQEIRSRIVRGKFQLGEPLSEIALATELGVSKTPVREALMILKRQGLIEVHAQRGSFVFDMDAGQVRQLSELREILEIAALRMSLAADRKALSHRWAETVKEMQHALDADDTELYRTLDGGFHRTLFDLAGNPYLMEAFELIAFRVQALRNRLSLAPSLNAKSFCEHQKLAGLVAAGNDEEAVELMEAHITGTREHYLAAIVARAEEAPPAPSKGRRRAPRS